jgi:hypothetical protein
VKRFGPFRLEALLEQLQRWEAIVRAELERLSGAARAPHHVRLFSSSETDIRALPGDVIVFDATVANVTIWLPEASLTTRGAQVRVCKSGGSNVGFVQPIAGTINGSNAFMTSATVHIMYLAVCIHGPNSGWVIR